MADEPAPAVDLDCCLADEAGVVAAVGLVAGAVVDKENEAFFATGAAVLVDAAGAEPLTMRPM